MAIKDKESFEAWKAEVLGKVTPEQQAALSGVLGSPVGEELFGGYLREKDYYTRLNRLNEEKAEKAEELNRMHQWYQEARPQFEQMAQKVAIVEQEKAQLAERLKTVGMSTDEASKFANEKYEKELAQLRQHVIFLDREAPNYANRMAKLAYKAQKEGYDFDPDQIFATAQQTGAPLEAAFDMVTAKTRGEREAKRQQEALEAAREEGRKQALTQFGTPDAPKPRGQYTSPLFQKLETTTPSAANMALRNEAIQAFYELSQ